jgi:hypothetical protein
MVTEVRNQTQFDAYSTAARLRARTAADRELAPRVIAATAVGLDQRRMILHLVILAIVIVAPMVAALAN